MVTHLAFITKNGKKQKTLALNNKKRGKAKSTQKKQKHTYLISGQTYISNNHHHHYHHHPHHHHHQIWIDAGNIERIEASPDCVKVR